VLKLFLCGDVMTGRGIDQILPHPCPPLLHEGYVESALQYVEIAEQANGPIERPVDFRYIWGAALDELDRATPDFRIINLETAVTTSEEYQPKGINYRMHPANAPCLAAAGIDCCVLANNHMLDWGEPGLLETLETLRAAGIPTAGAGRNIDEASAPVILQRPGGPRVIVFSFGDTSSGVPRAWAATARGPGVNLLPDLSDATVDNIGEQVQAVKQPGDVVVASIHWGGNWGYEVPASQRDFAHGLIDRAGVDVVHGHSSHHPKAIEIYRGNLIMYGCGDFLNDYEGIEGYEQYRDDLTVMYFPSVDPQTGKLITLVMTPMQIRKFRLNQPTEQDRSWLGARLDRECHRFGAKVGAAEGGRFALRWG
jgi:poly-gamma-glutamate capsule biosynthesis protein CapA/YwtB (metallophosphatase superfamily)